MHILSKLGKQGSPHESFMRRAIELASERSAGGENGPFGAVVVRAGEIIAEGWNQVVELRDPTAHAEIMAIRSACKKLDTHVLSDCALYASCEPCPMCLGAVYWARIPTLYYGATRDDATHAGFSDMELYREFSLPESAKSIAMQQILRKEAGQVLAAWQNNPTHIPY